MRNRKGIELAISTIAIIVMVLLVVLVVVEFFMGGFGAGTTGIASVSTQTSEQAGNVQIVVPKYLCTGTATLDADACASLSKNTKIQAVASTHDEQGACGYLGCYWDGSSCVLSSDNSVTSITFDCSKISSEEPSSVKAENACRALWLYGCKWEYTSE